VARLVRGVMFLTICLLGAVSSAQASPSAGYPSTAAVAGQVKTYINKSAARNHYVWRYTRVWCVSETTPGSLHCTAVLRWHFGRGIPMGTADWDVTTTTAGDWTAKSSWIFTGHVSS
jgi:hypothetical protein